MYFCQDVSEGLIFISYLIHNKYKYIGVLYLILWNELL